MSVISRATRQSSGALPCRSCVLAVLVTASMPQWQQPSGLHNSVCRQLQSGNRKVHGLRWRRRSVFQAIPHGLRDENLVSSGDVFAELVGDVYGIAKAIASRNEHDLT